MDRFELAEMHPNKQYIYNRAVRANSALPDGIERCITVKQMDAERCKRNNKLTSVTASMAGTFSEMGGAYDYHQMGREGRHWWVVFSGDRPLMAYNGAMFAQEEIAAAIHPALCHLKEALQKEDIVLRRHGRCDPLLVECVQCNVSLDLTNLYGRLFDQATKKQVSSSLTLRDPPTLSSLIFMTSHPMSQGAYTRANLLYLYETACAAFEGVTFYYFAMYHYVHTGHWGCGALGGNRVAVALMQMLAAATVSPVLRLVYHTFDTNGSEAYQHALALFQEWCTATDISVDQFIDNAVAAAFQWGESDYQ